MAPQPFRPMPLVRLLEPFDHPDWFFEVKHDGFRALAHITGHHCELRSRNGHRFKHWPKLCDLRALPYGCGASGSRANYSARKPSR
jgi:bifunctional non-homologous end joining protein LigD